MEKLGDSGNFHFHHDLGLLHDDCRRSTSFNDNRELQLMNLEMMDSWKLFQNSETFSR